MIYTIFPNQGGTGVYAHDFEGHPWTTFEVMNGSVECDECGKVISRGYVRGRMFEEGVRVCCEHVRWEGLHSEKG